MILVIYQWFVYDIRVKVSFNVSFIIVSASFCNPDLTYLNTIWQHRVPKIRGQKNNPCCALSDGTCQARPFLSLQSYDVLISMWWLIRSLLATSCILKIALFQVEVKSLYNTVNLLQNAQNRHQQIVTKRFKWSCDTRNYASHLLLHVEYILPMLMSIKLSSVTKPNSL